MAIKLNHTIVHSKDPRASAEFLSQLFGLPAPKPFGPFLDVEVANEVTLAFLAGRRHGNPDAALRVPGERYGVRPDLRPHQGAEAEVLGRSGQKQEGKTNTHFGGRGVYFEDPSGHLLEIITRPYGNWPA